MTNKECKYCDYCLENLMCLKVSCPKFDKQFAKYIIEKLKAKQYSGFETNRRSYEKLNNAKIVNVQQLQNLTIIDLKLIDNSEFKLVIKNYNEIESNCLNIENKNVISIFKTQKTLKVFLKDKSIYKIKFKSNDSINVKLKK